MALNELTAQWWHFLGSGWVGHDRVENAVGVAYGRGLLAWVAAIGHTCFHLLFKTVLSLTPSPSQD